ncbi:MAG: hypothetical protein R3B54_14515 [Bdellovibrionota bacterium]
MRTSGFLSEWIGRGRRQKTGRGHHRGRQHVRRLPQFRGGGAKDTSENVFRQIFLTKFKADLQREFGEAHYTASVYLRKPPTDFGAKRAAIQAGYNEGARLAKQLRSNMME